MVCRVLCLSFVYFKPTFRLSDFRLFKCFSICFVSCFLLFCFVFLVVVVFFLFFLLLLLFCFCFWKRATTSTNLKLVRFSPSTLIPSEMSAFLKISSITAVNSLGESESPRLTPLCIGNSSDTNLSKWILAVAWMHMFYKMFMHDSFMLVFLNA